MKIRLTGPSEDGTFSIEKFIEVKTDDVSELREKIAKEMGIPEELQGALFVFNGNATNGISLSGESLKANNVQEGTHIRCI
jgi:hypothetical protein